MNTPLTWESCEYTFYSFVSTTCFTETFYINKDICNVKVFMALNEFSSFIFYTFSPYPVNSAQVMCSLLLDEAHFTAPVYRV